MKTCPCGSGEPREEQRDGYGIFLTFTCSKCHARKMAGFRPDIFTRYDTDEPIEDDNDYGFEDDPMMREAPERDRGEWYDRENDE